jgi:hypothetical protein
MTEHIHHQLEIRIIRGAPYFPKALEENAAISACETAHLSLGATKPIEFHKPQSG